MSEAADDVLLKAGRALLYPGIAFTSLLLLRGPAGLPIGDLMMAAAGLFAALSMSRTHRHLPAMLMVAGAAIVVGSAISSTVSSDPAASITIGARLVYMVVVVPWILLNLLVTERHVQRAVLWWLGGAALCASGAIVQLVFGNVIPGGSISADSRFTGVTTHPSDLAGICVTATGAALAALSPKLPTGVRYCALLFGLICATALVLSGSVSGFLALAAVGLFLLFRGAINVGRTIAVGVVAGTVLVTVIAQIESMGALNPLERVLRTTGLTATQSEYDTAGTRMELLRRGWDAVKDRPFVGHGMLVEDNLLMKKWTVHNIFVAAWMSGGFLVLIGVVIATLIALRFCFRRKVADPFHIVIAASVVAAGVFAQTAPGLYNRYFWIPIAFAIFLDTRLRTSHLHPDMSSDSSRPDVSEPAPAPAVR